VALALGLIVWNDVVGRRPTMHIREREPGELTELRRRILKAKHADRRDRVRAVVLAI